jgi:hypothetical protein
MNPKTKDNLLIAVGLFGIVGFLYLYTVKLFDQHGKPLTSAFIETYIGGFALRSCLLINQLQTQC